ncbi:MAG: glycosyltransferase family 39 protein, partial [Acidobacteriaceae bacterium]|nr:glycosyltransferase family 39 protein [Acidobacteriaceae bacterium]
MSTRIKAHQKTRSKRPPAESIPAPPPTRAPAARWSRADLAISLAVLVITAAVYAQVAHFEFTNLDDPDYVANAHVCTGFTPATIAWAFTSREAANWFPLTRLSEILDCRLFGQRSGFHHLVNLFFHLLATLFLFLFLRRATYARWPSAFVAFLFALHPLHVESVAWVAERKDVLSAFFWFLTLWAYVFYTERRTPARYVLTLVSFAFGLMSKPMLVTLPCVLLLLDFWPLGRISLTRRSTRDRKPSNARVLLEKLPFFALTIAAAMITYSSQYHGRSVIRLTTLSLGQRCANALVSYIVYIAKALWPLNFAVFYPMRPIPAWQVVPAAVALVAITLLVIRILRSHAYLAVGWFWYLGTLVPVIGFVQVGRQARADRYMYIPLVGLSIMLAWGAAELIRRWPRAKIPTAVLAIAVCSFCAIQSFLQIRYWQNSGVLFEHAIAVTHENYLAETLLGAYLEQFPTRIPDALDHLEKGRAIAPPYSEAHKILAAALMN